MYVGRFHDAQSCIPLMEKSIEKTINITKLLRHTMEIILTSAAVSRHF